MTIEKDPHVGGFRQIKTMLFMNQTYVDLYVYTNISKKRDYSMYIPKHREKKRRKGEKAQNKEMEI